MAEQAANVSDWRGKHVVDREGKKVGRLEDVYYDTETDEPVFGTVRQGMLSKRTTFVPLRQVHTSPDWLQVMVTRRQVKDAPSLDATGELSGATEAALYEHYGVPYEAPATPSGRRLGRR
jgi:sporulation protein YlmC with PRC-barrel domain